MTIFSSRIRRLGVRLTAILAATVVLSSGLVGVSSASAAPASVTVDGAPVVVQVDEISRAVTALSGTNFDPGYIISDWSFYNANGMTQAQIQAFLDAKCPTNNCIDTKKMATTARAATNMCPSPYAASSSETFAAIIYKVQRSCGVSAKVILVTLQKEQGLLNLQNPTTLKLRKAMGMGCPDTSVCDSKYYGFFNQVYYGASQLKRYGLRTADNISFRTKYQIGVPYKIAYKTVASCGTRTVTVKTKATTALYYYTPYTPNAKALANLTGLGDSCSSYGNRNFWVYYNSWFGNSLAGRGNDAITAAYDKLGGAAGVLGTAGTTPNCATSTTCSQLFAHGVVYWTLKGGAFPVSGAFGDAYLAQGGLKGPLGVPIGPLTAVTSPTGNGSSQAFGYGQMVSSSAGQFVLTGAIRTKHNALSWVRGALGWPTANQVCVAGACSQTFQGGTIAHAKGGAAFVIGDGAIGERYAAGGGVSGSLGYPTGDVTAITSPTGNGTSQAFAGGQIVSSAQGTFALTGLIKAKHAELKWVRGALGWPTADQVCTADACSQTFQTGAIVVPTGSTAAFVIDGGPIGTKYLAGGGITGPLGVPLGAVTAITGPKGNGTSQAFKNGQILSSAKGTWALTGAIKAKHVELKWVRGVLGWPTADQVCTADNCSQAFQSGTIVVPTGGAAYVIDSGAIGTKYTATGGISGPLGAPIGAVTAIVGPKGNGSSQAFTNGQIVSSAKGTWVLTGAIRTKHAELKWVRGVLGWPTADQVCSGVVCSQKFMGGTITYNGTTTTVTY